MRTRSFAGAFALIVCAAAAAEDISPRGLSVAQIMEINLSGAGGLLLSPDGKKAAYTRRAGADARYPDVYVLDLKSREIRRVTESGANYALSWSPDSQRLAFFSTVNAGRTGLEGEENRGWRNKNELKVWDRRTGELVAFAQREIPRLPPAYAVRAQWSSDSRRVYVPAYPHGLLPVFVESKPVTPKSGPAEVFRFPEQPVKRSHSVFYSAPIMIVEVDIAARTLHDIGDSGAQSFQENLHMGADLKNGTERLPTLIAFKELLISPDGLKLAVVTNTPGGFFTDDSAKKLKIFDLSGPEKKELKFADAGLKKVGLGPNSKFIAWSPDSRRLAIGRGVYSPVHFESQISFSDLFIVDLPARRIVSLTAGRTGSDGKPLQFRYDSFPPVWSTDGSALYAAQKGELWRIPLDRSKTIGLLTAGEEREFVAPLSLNVPYNHQVYGGPAFAAIPGASLSPSVYALTRKRTDNSCSLVVLDELAGRWNTLFTMGSGQIAAAAIPAAAAPGARVLLESSSSFSPRDWYLLDPHAGRGERLQVSSGAGATMTAPISQRQLLEWTLPNGQSANGVLLLPPATKAGAKLPVIVKFYPGTEKYDAALNAWLGGDLEHGPELLVSRGYAVFMAGLPLNGADRMRQIKEHLDVAVDKAIATGYVDERRMGVIGLSYGAYGVFSLEAFPSRFKAGVAVNGASDLVVASLGTEMGAGWVRGQGGMPGSIWENRDAYIANSPVYHLDRAQIPLLVVAGKKDDIFSPTGAMLMFEGLKQNNVPVEYALYDAGHDFGDWSAAMVADYWERVFKWFDRYLVEHRVAAQ